MEDIFKYVYKVTEVNDKNVWEELQKRDFVVLKLMTMHGNKKLKNIPYNIFFSFVGRVNVEIIKYYNWYFFSVLPPVSQILKTKNKEHKFAFFVEEEIYADVSPNRYYFIPVEEKDAYNFVRSRKYVLQEKQEK
jgi:hypothetical protein